MTNYERIKSMTMEEMAKWLEGFSDCTYCIYSCHIGHPPGDDCIEGVKQWLQAESEGDYD